MYEIGDWVMLKAPPMAGKFINRWNGPYKITKNYSKVNYEIENIEDKKQKRMVVHVNRLKKFNQRENNTTLTNPSKQEPQENEDTQKAEEKQTNPETTTVKRGRGRPRKNVQQASKVPFSEPNQNYLIRSSSNRQTRNQTTQTRNQSREPRQPRFRSNGRNQANSSFANLPPWRGRLRSSSSSSQNHPHHPRCLCPRCQPLRSKAQCQADDNCRPTYRYTSHQTPLQFLPRHLTIGRRDPCFPHNISTEQFCINHPSCTHYRQHMMDLYHGGISTLNHLPTTLHVSRITLIHTRLRLQPSEDARYPRYKQAVLL